MGSNDFRINEFVVDLETAPDRAFEPREPLRPATPLPAPQWPSWQWAVVPHRRPPVFAPDVPLTARRILDQASNEELESALKHYASQRLAAWLLTVTFLALVIGAVLFGHHGELMYLMTIGMVAGGGAGIVGALALKHRRLLKVRHYREAMIRPEVDLDPFGQSMLDEVTFALNRVSYSRAAREGHIPGWRHQLQDERWRIARASAKLARARRMLGPHDAEQAHAAAVTAEAIEKRVEEFMRFAATVQEIDDSLAARDAVLHRDVVAERLRQAYLSASAESGLRDLELRARQVKEEIDAGVAAVRALDS